MELFVKKGYMWNSNTCDCQCDKTCEIGEYLDINSCTSKQFVFDKSVPTCKYELVNTSRTRLVNALDKKLTHKRDHCLLQ